MTDALASPDWELYSRRREIPGQGLCGLFPFLFTTGLCVDLTAVGFRGRYCFEHQADAIAAIENWTGEGDPPGPWIKYKGIDGERLPVAIPEQNQRTSCGGTGPVAGTIWQVFYTASPV